MPDYRRVDQLREELTSRAYEIDGYKEVIQELSEREDFYGQIPYWERIIGLFNSMVVMTEQLEEEYGSRFDEFQKLLDRYRYSLQGAVRVARQGGVTLPDVL